MFSFISVWINGWVNNREAGDLRRYHAHYDVIVITHGLKRLFHYTQKVVKFSWYRIFADGNDFPHSVAHFVLEINYSDVIMSAMASQITGVFLAVCPGADQRKHQSSAPMAFLQEFTGNRWIPRTKGQ